MSNLVASFSIIVGSFAILILLLWDDKREKIKKQINFQTASLFRNYK